jgi:SAM-dependent methyltransferase
MQSYLEGRCEFRTHLISVPLMPGIPSGSVDLVLAHGVVEHLDFDEIAFFLDEFLRVLKPGGRVSFNYNSMHSAEGVEWFRQRRREPGNRCIFRFYTPDFMHRLAEISGFSIGESYAGQSRLAHVVLVKPTS